MATRYSPINYGPQPDAVKKLRKLSGQGDYTLDENGSSGAKTQGAVKQNQQGNGLGAETMSSTLSTYMSDNTDDAAATDAAESIAAEVSDSVNSGVRQNSYTESDAVRQAYELLQQQIANQPGDYQSTWQSQLNDIIQQIMNREKFSYDLNGDALYQQYKDKYIQQGKMAMLDTMGQAQAMTGGYGNSYAQSVGQQAYQAQLQNLNDVVPELYQMALDQYNQEGQDLYNQYSLLGAQEEQDYSRYRDSVSDYYTELSRLLDQYNTEREFDYGQYSDDRAYEYQGGRDQVEDEQWQAEFDEAVRQFNYANGITDEDSSSNGTGTSGGNGGNGGGNYNQETAEVQQMLRDAGYEITVDGIWGTQTQEAYDDWLAKQNSQPTEVESAMDSYVSAMLNGLLQHGGSQADPAKIINANSNLTEEEKRVALEILAAYLEGGYMGSP